MAVERIFGTETGKSAFEKTDRNIVALDASLTADKLDLATHKAESASKHIKESGSNANGRYIKFDDGTLICWRLPIAMTFVNTSMLRAIWTFPAFFIENPTINYNSTGNLPVGATKRLGLFHTNAISTTKCDLEYYNGNAPFVDGDIINGLPTAIGRWK